MLNYHAALDRSSRIESIHFGYPQCPYFAIFIGEALDLGLRRRITTVRVVVIVNMNVLSMNVRLDALMSLATSPSGRLKR